MSLGLTRLVRWTGLRVSFLLSVLLAAIYVVHPSILELFELKAYDYRLQWRGALSPTGKVVIVAIDERSLEKLGQWPWPRLVMAQIIEALTQAGAKVIGLDVFWPEPEQRLGVIDTLYRDKRAADEIPLLKGLQSRLIQLAQKNSEMDAFLREVSRTVHPDVVLAEAIRASRRVVLGDFFLMNPEKTRQVTARRAKGELPLLAQSEYPIVRASRAAQAASHVQPVEKIKGNIPVIAGSARAFGYTTTFPDADGVVRSVPLVVEYNDHFLPPLSVQTLRYAGDPSAWILQLEPYGVDGIQWKRRRIPTTEMGRMYINYRGERETFPYVSAVDVIEGHTPAEEIRDKIVLVGAVAEGTYDLRPTPVASVFPGVEIHANIIDNILRGDFIRRPAWARMYDLLLLLAIGLAFGWIFNRLRPAPGAVIMLVGFSAHAYFNTWMLNHHGTWLNIIFPSIMIPTSFLGVSVYKYIHEEREKRMIKGAFQHYVAPEVVNQMLRDPGALRLGGEQKVLTVLFSDIRGFTGISETLRPEELVRLLNEYFTEMTSVVFRNQGTLDKYIGDAIMAIYGAPVPLEDHPYRACTTALDMRDELHNLRAGWNAREAAAIDIGIGINTGEMVVGNMGSERRFDYTVIGDHVNLASRLEGLNKQYGSHIIVSEFTHAHVSERLLCRELDWVRVKGKAKPVQIYELIGRRSQLEEKLPWLEIFTQGIWHYRNLEFDRALAFFQQVLELRPEDRPSSLYVERCELLRSSQLPAHWDRVFEWKTK